MSIPTFYTPINQISSALTTAHVIADGHLVVASGSIFGSPSSGNPIRVTAASGGSVVIFAITGRSSNTLTIGSVLEGTSDIALPSGTTISCLFTAGHLQDAYDGINSLSTDLATKATDTGVVHTTGTETIGGVKTFSTVPILGSLTGVLKGTSGTITAAALISTDIPKTLDHTWITDFDTQVRTSRLDQMAAPTATVSMNSQKITNLTDPTSAQDAATKNYVDITTQGFSQKPSAIAATTTALPANTYANGTSGVGATLTGNSNGALSTQDGHGPAVNDIILVKNESVAATNGLYVVTQLGDGSHPYIITRHADMDQAGEIPGGFVPVVTGTTNSGSLWLVSTTGAITVGATGITFVELNKATDLQQGTGITISGNTVGLTSGIATPGTYSSITVDTYGRVTAGADVVTSNGMVSRTASGTFAARTIGGTTNRVSVTSGDGVSGNPAIDIAATYVGQTSITTLGTIATGTWAGTTVALIHGGTGATTQGGAANAVLPSQSTNSGKYLTTDGTNASWGTVSGGGSPGGSAGNLQFNNSGSFGGASDFNRSSSGNYVLQGSSTTELVIKPGSSDLAFGTAISIKDASSVEQIQIRYDGFVGASQIAAQNGTAAIFQGPTNGSALPGINFASSLYLNWTDNTQWYAGSPDLQLGRADVGVLAITSNVTSNGALILGAPSATTVGLTISAFSGQSVDIVDVKSSGGSSLVSVASDGTLVLSALKMASGASSGYVLTSDGSGNASWAAAAASIAIGNSVSSATGGGVLFLDGTSHLDEDSSQFSYDSSTGTLTVNSITIKNNSSTPAGYVLTADSSGNGTWLSPGGGSAGFMLTPTDDASAGNNSIFLSTDHLDGLSSPKLCRTNGSGTVTVIG